jgi:hypothetical protein
MSQNVCRRDDDLVLLLHTNVTCDSMKTFVSHMHPHSAIDRIESALVKGLMCLNLAQSIISRQIQLNTRVFENVHQRYTQCCFCHVSTTIL